MELKVSYSGIRFKQENPGDLGPKFAAAYRDYLGKVGLHRGTIVLGSDTRPTSPVYKGFFIGALEGYKLVDLGISPTPTVGRVMRANFNDAVGGVMVTSSHNPQPWNGLKLLQPNGLCLDYNDIMWLKKRAESCSARNISGRNTAKKAYHLRQGHLDAIAERFPGVKGFRVAVDACNGAARRMLPQLLRMRQRGRGIHREGVGSVQLPE